jgi:hypothetical protein
MKNIKSLVSLVLIIILASTGCKKLENLLDVTFNAEYTVNLEAVIPPASDLKQSAGVFSACKIIDPNSNSEFSAYADKIKKIEITSISAKVLSINKPVTIKMASIAIFSETGSTAWNFSNEAITVGKILTLGNESSQWIIAQNIFTDKNIFTILLDGETNVDDVNFTLEVTIKTKVTANPLED